MYEETRKYLAENVGKSIKIKGKISDIMWQRITTFVETHPNLNYFDLEDGFQIVVYTKEKITCKNQVEVFGKIIEIRGPPKEAKSKVNDDYVEYHITAESWKCVEE